MPRRAPSTASRAPSNVLTSFNQPNADNPSYPSADTIPATSFIYDNPADPNIYPLAAGQRNLKGRISVARSYRLGVLAAETFYSYDEFGRVEWLTHSQLGSFWKKVKYTYDLQDRITKKENIDLQSTSYDLYTFYEYDQVGRLTKVSTDTDPNGGTKVKEGEYSYFAANTTKQLRLGNANIQDVDYRYNTRDWLTRLNDVDNLGGDKFAQNLHYQSVIFGTPRYNGNIASIRWTNTGVASYATLGYAFGYDNANRVTSAQTYFYTPPPPAPTWSTMNNWKEPTITYDAT